MSKLIKVLIVATSIAPILITYWFIDHANHWNDTLSAIENIRTNWQIGLPSMISAIVLFAGLIVIIRSSKKKLESVTIEIEEIKTADNESVAFILVYLLPLASGLNENFNLPILVFVSIVFFFFVMSSNSYHFNPLMNLIGYHFYEVQIKGGITYVLVTKKSIKSSKTIKQVQLLSEYMIIDNN